jgi:hypothetical protein
MSEQANKAPRQQTAAAAQPKRRKRANANTQEKHSLPSIAALHFPVETKAKDLHYSRPAWLPKNFTSRIQLQTSTFKKKKASSTARSVPCPCTRETRPWNIGKRTKRGVPAASSSARSYSPTKSPKPPANYIWIQEPKTCLALSYCCN